jgi:hypothetical protein
MTKLNHIDIRIQDHQEDPDECLLDVVHRGEEVHCLPQLMPVCLLHQLFQNRVSHIDIRMQDHQEDPDERLLDVVHREEEVHRLAQLVRVCLLYQLF